MASQGHFRPCVSWFAVPRRSTEEGRIWQEYLHGTRSRLALPCPHCAAWVTLEREHLLGWKEADSQVAASATAAFFCTECGEAWTDE